MISIWKGRRYDRKEGNGICNKLVEFRRKWGKNRRVENINGNYERGSNQMFCSFIIQLGRLEIRPEKILKVLIWILLISGKCEWESKNEHGNTCK